jgi:hypothetical protein
VANEPLKGSTLERKSHIIDKQNYLMKTEALPKPIFQQPASASLTLFLDLLIWSLTVTVFPL